MYYQSCTCIVYVCGIAITHLQSLYYYLLSFISCTFICCVCCFLCSEQWYVFSVVNVYVMLCTNCHQIDEYYCYSWYKELTPPTKGVVEIIIIIWSAHAHGVRRDLEYPHQCSALAASWTSCSIMELHAIELNH